MSGENVLSSIPVALDALRKGKFVVVMDDESRENEGDLIIAAQFLTPEKTAFLVRHTNGILCVPMTASRAETLNLPPMTAENEDRNATAFTVSCDVKRGTTTGASATDRTLTARALADPTAKPEDFARPGHIFPLIARPRGVLERRGHTEATVDLCSLAGLESVGVICELMHPDGHMMRFDECAAFARSSNLHMITVEQLHAYRVGNPDPMPHFSPQHVEQLLAAEDLASQDLKFMRRALVLSEYGRLTAPPNPWVGCVLVKDGLIIGEGWHKKAGDLHAEAVAIRDVKQRFRGNESAAVEMMAGCTAYVTLEPCAHQGRQPPCDQALIAQNVRRVVVAVTDPDSRVNSKGFTNLREAGIEVVVGVLEREVRQSLQPYLHHRQASRPWCVLKVAMSIDGKVACADKTSQWITNAESRQDVHQLRARSQAIIVGSNTAMVDNPKLNVRLDGLSEEFVQPLRVLLDAHGRITSGHLLDQTISKTLIFTTLAAPADVLNTWKAAGVEVRLVPLAETDPKGVDLGAVMAELGKRGIMQAMVEGGSLVHGSFLAAKLVDELWVYTGAKLIGHGGFEWPVRQLTTTIADADSLTLKSVERMGETGDVCCKYEFK